MSGLFALSSVSAWALGGKKASQCVLASGCLIEVNCLFSTRAVVNFGCKFGHQSVNAFLGPGAVKNKKHKHEITKTKPKNNIKNKTTKNRTITNKTTKPKR